MNGEVETGQVDWVVYREELFHEVFDFILTWRMFAVVLRANYGSDE